MTPPFDPDDVDLLLRLTPAPLPLPDELEERSRRAALPHRHRPPVRVAVGLAAALLLTAVIGLVLATASQAPDRAHTIFHLTGADGANATVTIGASHNHTASVLLAATHLPTITPGHYYELWFAVGNHRMPALAFLPLANGAVTTHTTIPTTSIWTRCWISIGQSPRRILAMQMPTWPSRGTGHATTR